MRPSCTSGPTRRAMLTAVALALGAVAGCAGEDEVVISASPLETDPARVVDALTAGLARTNPYRDPDVAERSQARRAARLLLDDPDDRAGQEETLGGLGFRVQHGTDPATGRPFTLFLASGSDRRSWGALLVDRAGEHRHVIQVPHPGFDINTEKLGLALHRRLPGSLMLVAGAHREAADGAADVAHNSRSLFHTLAVEFARRGLDQVQLHGFADRNLAGSDAVVSTGSAPRNQLARRIADGLSDISLRTCRAWSQRCGQLEGTRNEQGRAAAELDSAFIHLELSYSIRRDAAGRDLVADVLAEQLTRGG